MLREFHALTGNQVGRIAFGRCSTDSPQLQISIRGEAPRDLDGFFGLAHEAGHEASHCLEQQAQHCMFGLMRAALPAHALVSKDIWRGRRQSRCQIGQALATGG